MSKQRLTILVAIITVAVSSSLAGCAETTSPPAGSSSTQSATPTTIEPVPSLADWPKVDQSGVGPTTITVENPSPEAAYFKARFQWSDGEGSVELVEDPRIFMSGSNGGNGGGRGGYQMTLPTESKEYTFKIDVGPDTTYSFSGTFITGK